MKRRRESSDEPKPGRRYGADGFYADVKSPHILCPKCHGGGIDPPCCYCHGIGAILVLSFGPPPPKRPTSRLRPEMVLMLRHVGCKMPDYPVHGTPEWEAFEADYKNSLKKKLDAIPKLPKIPARPARERAKKQVITQEPSENLMRKVP